ncbi:MAG: lactonase family protein [Pyrinomonadaceae bacterium]
MSNNAYARRDFLKTAALLPLTLSLHTTSTAREKAKEMLLYIGTYTSGKSEGIYIYRMNTTTGELKHSGTAKGVVNPSFLAIDSRRRYLYAVNEVDEFGGKKSGAISSFAIDRSSGDLRFMNQQPSLGAAPCHVSVSANDRFVLVANYNGGNVSVFPVQPGGELDPASDLEQHKGAAGINPERQEGPHAHCIILDRSNRYAFAADLGLDKIMIYKFDSRTGKLTPHESFSTSLKPGAGPRHFTFHPDGRYAYVINELDSTVTAFTYDKTRGMLKEMQTINTLPSGFSGHNDCADIHVSPSGKFLYGSNRGHDSIVVFAIDEQTGKLTYVEHVSTQGKTPRNFTLDPTGAFLLAANQESDTVVTFRINQQTGKLTPTGHIADVPSPVCLKLIQPFA